VGAVAGRHFFDFEGAVLLEQQAVVVELSERATMADADIGDAGLAKMFVEQSLIVFAECSSFAARLKATSENERYKPSYAPLICCIFLGEFLQHELFYVTQFYPDADED
jgi:hypothetical protein